MQLARARFSAELEVRQAAETGDTHRVNGLVVPFNSRTRIFRNFYEEFRKGAFTRTLTDDSIDSALLIEHGGMAIARQSNNSVAFRETRSGLEFEAHLDRNDPDVQRVIPKLRNGNISDMSVGFIPRETSYHEDDDETTAIRTDVDLYEASFVTFPAYEGTSAEARKLYYTKPEPHVKDNRFEQMVARLEMFRRKYDAR